MKLYIISSLFISINILLLSYIALVLINISKGFYQGYAGYEVKLDISDFVCFYYRAGFTDIIKIGREANKIKSLNFSANSLDYAVNLVHTLNTVKNRIDPCLNNIRNEKINNKSKLNTLKKIGNKFLEIIPFGSKIKAGIASIEMAMQFKELVYLIDKFKVKNLLYFWRMHENSEIIALSVGRLCYTLDGLFDNDDLKIIKELLNIIRGN